MKKMPIKALKPTFLSLERDFLPNAMPQEKWNIIQFDLFKVDYLSF